MSFLPVVATGVISGQLFDQRSRPMVGATAELFSFSYNRYRGRSPILASEGMHATANDRGEYRLPDVQPGSYLVLLLPPLPLMETSPGASFYPGVRETSLANEVERRKYKWGFDVFPPPECRIKSILFWGTQNFGEKNRFWSMQSAAEAWSGPRGIDFSAHRGLQTKEVGFSCGALDGFGGGLGLREVGGKRFPDCRESGGLVPAIQ
jgi:hypothetical protein